MRSQITFLAVCLVAWVLSFGGSPESVRPAAGAFPGWPSSFEGRALVPIELEEREKRFYEDFPGQVARFSDGEREIILRWVSEETHKLHPAAICFRGRGFEIEPRDGMLDASGRRWGTFRASCDGEVFDVRELVYSETESWSDVSAWYWAATLRRTSGPWWTVMVAE